MGCFSSKTDANGDPKGAPSPDDPPDALDQVISHTGKVMDGAGVKGAGGGSRPTGVSANIAARLHGKGDKIEDDSEVETKDTIGEKDTFYLSSLHTLHHPQSTIYNNLQGIL